MFRSETTPGTRLAVVICMTLLGFVSDARAHIDLVSPVPRERGPSREPNSNVKQGPCGQEVNGRTDKVSVLSPGETLEVTWVESTNHRSYYRIAFDLEGDDAFPTFVGSGIGTEGIDPSGLCPVDGQVILAYDMDDRSGGSHTVEVRLPDVECERCTLQVVQFMYDTARPYYFQCADIALRRTRQLADAGSSVAGASSIPSDAATSLGPGSPAAAPGCWSQIGATDPRAPAGDDDDGADDADSDDERARAGDRTPPAAAAADPSSAPAPRRADGCSLAPVSGSTTGSALLLIGAYAAARARRTRQRRARAHPAS